MICACISAVQMNAKTLKLQEAVNRLQSESKEKDQMIGILKIQNLELQAELQKAKLSQMFQARLLVMLMFG